MLQDNETKKLVLIAGYGEVGSRVAKTLLDKGNHVVVIDQNVCVFSALSDEARLKHIVADATDISILERVGIKDADMVLAVTDNQHANLMIAEIAKAIYKVPLTIVCMDGLENKPWVQEVYGLKAISPIALTIAAVEQLCI